MSKSETDSFLSSVGIKKMLKSKIDSFMASSVLAPYWKDVEK